MHCAILTVDKMINLEINWNILIIIIVISLDKMAIAVYLHPVRHSA